MNSRKWSILYAQIFFTFQKFICILCDKTNLFDKGNWLSLVPFNNSGLLKAGEE